MSRVVTMSAPKEEQNDGDAPDGYWGRTPRERLRDTRDLARAMQVPWLPPYVPRYDKAHTGRGWETTVGGYLRATPARALRLHFGDSARLADDCTSCRVLSLAAQWKAVDDDVRWADMGDVSGWPMALRVDARRLEEQFAAVAIALWCPACDDAPAASPSRYCLWCERQAPMPATAHGVRRAA